MGYQSFKELKIWKNARSLRNEVFKLTKTFPSQEKYRLSDQLIRCSRSVTANIAEGHGRHHFQENIQFCRLSRGSLTELQDHLTVALDCGYISESEFEKYTQETIEILKMLNGYINFLKKLKEEI